MPNAPTRGLGFLYRHLRRGTGRVIRGTFHDADGNGCLVEWLGRFHRNCCDEELPGQAFMTIAGVADGSAFIQEWDTNPEFRGELLKLLRDELRLRRRYGARRAAREEVAPCC
jgi:hypothetical protein